MAAGAAVIGLIGAGLTETGAAGLGLAFIVIAAGLYWKGEAVADRLDVGPAVDVIEHTEPGMGEKEVQEFWTLHQEYGKIKEEQREEATKDLKTGGNSGTLNKQ